MLSQPQPPTPIMTFGVQILCNVGFQIDSFLFILDSQQDSMGEVALFLLLLFAVGCQYPWVRPDDLNRGLPSSVSIYTLCTSQSPFSTKLTGGYAKFDMNDPSLEFVVKDTNGDALGYFPKTPMEYAEQEQNIVYAVINGGYFDMEQNISASFLAESWKVKSKNNFNEASNKHPTVGAFGLENGTFFTAEYVYSFGNDFATYKFKYPNHYPGPVINPELGERWKVKEGVGAGPILIKNHEVITANLQNFNQANMIDFRHPRSAICVNMYNHLYFVAIDGRYEDSDGMMMPELAQLMQSLNCKDAMNLDGGGSTLLYANNAIINHPSDAAGPRPVVSAVLIRDRYKKKPLSQQ